MPQFQQAIAHIKSFPTAFWILISAVVINQMGNAAMVFLILYLTVQLHFSVIVASYVFAAFGISMLLTRLLGGTLIDRFGGARMMISVLLLNGFILLSFPLLQHLVPVMVMSIMWGFVYGLYQPAGQTFVAILTPQNMHKLAFTVYRFAINLGMSIGPAIGGYLAMHSFPSVFMMNGISNIFACIMLFVGLKNTPWFNQKASIIDSKLEFSLKWLKRDPLLLWLVIGLIPVELVFFQHESTLSIFLTRDLQWPASFYGLLFTLNTLLIVFFELALNILILSWSPRLSLMTGTVFITIGFAGLFFVSMKWHVLVLAVLWTIGEMILFPASSSYVADISPPGRRGSYMGIYSACSSIGLFLGPLLGAVIMHHFSSSSLWIACAIWGVMSFLIFGLMPYRSHSSAYLPSVKQ
jgi:MFS family permease